MRLFKLFWPLPLGLLVLVAAILCFFNAWNQLTTYRVVFYYAQISTLLLACLIIPLCSVLTAIQIRRSMRNAGTRRRLILLSFGVFVVANVIACGALPSFHNSYASVTTAFVNDHLNRLDTIETGVWSDLSEEFLLWECDRSGLFCR